MKRLLCRVGLHDWRSWGSTGLGSGLLVDQVCARPWCRGITYRTVFRRGAGA